MYCAHFKKILTQGGEEFVIYYWAIGMSNEAEVLTLDNV
jgi:hypothetical protein